MFENATVLIIINLQTFADFKYQRVIDHFENLYQSLLMFNNLRSLLCWELKHLILYVLDQFDTLTLLLHSTKKLNHGFFTGVRIFCKLNSKTISC